METTGNYGRYSVVAIGCFLLASAAILGAVTSMENDIKKRLSLTQKQIELMISMANVGFNLGLPCGLVLERFGPRWASLSAAVVSVTGQLGFYLAMKNPEEFGGSLFWLFIVSVTISGVGTMHMYMNGIAVNAYNFQSQHRGRVIGGVAACYFLGFALFSTTYKAVFGSGNILNFVKFAMCVTVFMNLVAMVFLKKVPPDTSPETKMQQSVENKDEKRKEQTSSEKENLIETPKSLKIVYYGEYNLSQALNTVDFHLIGWTCVMSTSVSFAYSMSVPAFLESFHLSNLQSVLMFIGPTLGGIFKFLSGISSDLTLTRVQRTTYSISVLILQTTTMVLCCFFGDNTFVVILTSNVQFISLAVFMALTPMLLSDSFGTKYFARLWGTVCVGTAAGNFALAYSMGAIYDSQIEGDGDTCYGLKCFTVIFIISSLLCVICIFMMGYLHHSQKNLWNFKLNSEVSPNNRYKSENKGN